MNRGTWTVLAGALALLLLGGCGDDDGGGDDEGSDAPDAGDAAPQDAGTDAGDQLVWMPMDVGSDDTSSSNGGDGDASDPLAGRECAQVREPLPELLLPRCSATTGACIESCPQEADPEACRDACLAADDTEEDGRFGLACDSCVFLQIFACIDRAGCHEGVAEFFCCMEDRCGPGSAEGCIETECGAELETAITCGYFADETCVDFLGPLPSQCFAEGDADGGV